MERNPEQRDPEADNREQPQQGGDGEEQTPVDGPGGAEDGEGSTSQDEPEPG